MSAILDQFEHSISGLSPSMITHLYRHRMSRVAELNGWGNEAIAGFMLSYLHLVPETFRDIAAAAASNGLNITGDLYDCVERITGELSRDFEEGAVTAAGLVQTAYALHRLTEEIGDLVVEQLGIPLCHHDMTLANVLIHTLLTESRAAELDALIDRTIAGFPARGDIGLVANLERIGELRRRSLALTGKPRTCAAEESGFLLPIFDQPRH